MNNAAPVAVITGSAQRIGYALAQAFHEAGYNVVLHYRNTPVNDLLHSLNQKREGSAVSVQADITEYASAEKITHAALACFGRADLLINNASSFYPVPVGEGTEAHWDDLFGSNAKGPYFISQALAPTLIKNKGCIINFADVYAQNPKPKHTLYCMAKAANAMLTKSLAIELAPHVRVNGIAPGAALWPEGDAVRDEEKALKRIPLQRIGGTESIVTAALYLAKEESYMTGQILNVDGGKSINGF